ncbi:hypothetical protein [Aquipseudomonas ullengensis]|nr:hypothetical protein [Pseudomonas ullengensis]
MSETQRAQPINAQLLYLHRLSGVRYSATFESASSYALTPIHGAVRHASVKELANAEVWQLLP